MNRMTELLERINYDLPGLKKAKMCYAQGDADGAMDAVIEHFRTRTTPKYLFTAKEMEQCKVDGILEDAQETLDHYIYGHKFDGEIDWFFNPTEHTSHDNEWTWSLYRHIYWQPLARAYALTKDEKYTKEFLHEMTEWGKAWPVTPFMENEEDAAAKYKFPGHSWRTIETAMRIYTVWLPCMEAFRTSPAWDREGWVTFLTLLCDHADFLMTHYSNHKKSSNWLTMESGTLLECGILFPEIKSDWFMTGYRRVMQEVKYSFDNDGIHMERTPIYHMVAAGVYFQCYRLCKLNGIPVPPYMEPTLEKSAQFIMSLVKPDLSTPMIGDADRDDLTTRRCDTSLYEGMNLTFDPYDLNEMRAYFRTWYEETGREDFRFMATAGKEGTPPAQRNYKYIPAGIYVMRTGWGPEDSYFHVHGIQLERGEVSSHSHNDTGHVEIHARGEDILTDSGRYIYNSSCWKDWRHYFLSAKAHNTLYVDDHEMGTVPGVTRTRGVRTYLHAFEENEQYQLIDISNAGNALQLLKDSEDTTDTVYTPQEWAVNWEERGRTEETIVYENQNFIPMGFAYDYYITKDQLADVDADVRSNLLLKAIVLNDEQVGKYGDILQPLPEKEFQNLNFESFKKDCADRRKQTADTFETNNYGFTATTSFDTDELVFFSVPYEKNAFTATVNGEPVNVEEVDCGLMAIPVPAGEADIVVTYHTPGLKASITISIAGIIIWILYAFVCYNKGKKKGTPELQEAKESTEVVE